MYSSSYNYYGYNSYSRAAELSETFAIIAAVLAVVSMFLILIFITPQRKRDKLPGFFRLLHDIFNFNGLIIEVLLKATYIVATVYTILYSFLMIFTGEDVIVWIISMIVGPIAIRIFFELIMMGVLLVKNVISINNKLKYPENKKPEDAFKFDYTKYTTPAVQQNTNAAEFPAMQKQDELLTCPGCGNTLSGTETFCGRCGTKISR